MLVGALFPSTLNVIPAAAVATPDPRGTYSELAHRLTPCCDDFPSRWAINTFDPTTGQLAGTGVGTGVITSTYTIAGTLVGSQLTLHLVFQDGSGYTADVVGTIQPDRSMSGTFTDSLQQSGTWIATPICAGMTTSGAITAVPPPPSLLPGAFTSTTEIRFFCEQQNVVLQTPITADAAPPGSPVIIPAGTTVDSFFLHANAPDPGATLDGSVTLDRQILGIVFTDGSLDQTDFLGASGTVYPSGVVSRGIETGQGDSATIGPDGRTVTVHLGFSMPGDEVRIITTAAAVATPVDVQCISSGQLCDPSFTTTFISPDFVAAEFIASPAHCSDVRIFFRIDGNLIATTDFLTPGQSSGVEPFPALSPGQHQLSLQAEGRLGGCNSGQVTHWEGTLLLFKGSIVISTVTPGWAPFTGGTTVTITGANFGANPQVRFADNCTLAAFFLKTATITSATPTSITVTVPSADSPTAPQGLYNVGLMNGPGCLAVFTTSGTAVAAFTYVVPEIGMLISHRAGYPFVPGPANCNDDQPGATRCNFAQCTAEVVQSHDQQLLVTAGHCVYGRDDFAFAPGFFGPLCTTTNFAQSWSASQFLSCGGATNTPYGIWCAGSVFAIDPGCGDTFDSLARPAPQFASNPNTEDFGYIEVAPQAGLTVGQKVGGGLSITFNVGVQANQNWNIFGWNNNYLVTCNTPTIFDKGNDAAAVLRTPVGGTSGCGAVVGGASGGAWINGQNGALYGIGAVNDTAAPGGTVTGAYMGHLAKSLYKAMQHR